MICKTVWRGFLATLFLVTLGLVGCSDDIDRITTSGTEFPQVGLSTGTDQPVPPAGDYEYYYFDTETEVDVDDWDIYDPYDRFDTDNPSNKPLDRGSD